MSERDYRWNFFVNSIDYAFFSLGMTLGSISTLFPLLARNLGASNVEIGLIPAVANLGWGIPAILGAKYAERARRKLDLVLKVTLGERLPYLFMALVCFFVAARNAKLALYLSISMLGVATFSMGFLGPPWMSMIEKVIDKKRRGTFFAVGNGLGALMGVGGSILARHFLDRYPFPKNFGYSFSTAFAFFMVSFVFLALTREAPDEPDPTSGDPSYVRKSLSVFRDKNFRNYILERITNSLMFASSGFVTVYLIERLSLPDRTVAEFTAALMISQGVSSFLVGPLGDKLGHKVTLAVGKVLYALAMVLTALCRSLPMALSVYALLGFVNTTNMVGSPALTLDLVPRNKKEMYMGVLYFSIAPFSFAAPLLGGKIADWWGYESLFLGTALIGVFSTLFLLYFVEDPRGVERKRAR